MQNLKKYSLLLAAMGMTTLPIVTVVACGANNNNPDANASKKWLFNSHRNVHFAEVGENGQQPYVGKDFYFAPDKVTKDSAMFSEAINSYSTQGFQVFVDGFPKYNFKGELESGSSVSKAYLKFSMYDKVTIVPRDASKDSEVFDSDSFDLDDAKSINGNHFNQLINEGKIKSIKFHLRENVYYTENKTGNKSNKKVTLEDYATGINNQLYASPTTRHNGNTPSITITALDKNANVKARTSLKPPTATAARSLWEGTFGAKYGMKLYKDTSKYLEQETNSIKFDFEENTRPDQFFGLWNDRYKYNGDIAVFLDSNEFAMPQGADKVPDELANLVWDDIKKAKAGATEVDQKNATYLTEAEKNASSLADVKALIWAVPAYQKGFYKYLEASWDSFKTAAPYYLKSVENKNIIFQQNPYYVDSSWVQDQNSVASLQYDFIDSAEGYEERMFLGYQQGLYASSTYELLDNSTKTLIKNNAAEYGLHYSTKTVSRDQVGQRWTRFNYLPMPVTEAGKKNFFFNDGFAKVVYGATINQLAGVTNADGVDPLKSSLTGAGAEFKSSIYAAINWYAANSEYSSKQEWTSRLAPDQTFEKDENAIDVEEIYSTYGLGLNEDGKFSSTQVTHEERKEQANDISSGNNPYFASNQADMDKLKDNVTDAIDRANLGADEKVMFELPIDYSSYPNKKRIVLEKIRKAVEALDRKNRIVVAASMIPIDGTKIDANETQGKATLNSNEEFRLSYLPDKNWTLKGVNPSNTDDLASKYIFPRIDRELGTAAFQINSSQPFTSDTLTQVFNYLQYLQDGVFGTIAYYSLPENKAKLPENMDLFGDFAAKFADELDAAFQGITVEQFASQLKETNFDATSPEVIEAVAALNAFKTRKTVGSSAKDINLYDYFGLAGDATWTAWVNKINAEDISLPLKKIRAVASNIFTETLIAANFQMRKFVDSSLNSAEKYSREEKIEIFTGFDTLIGSAFTFWFTTIDNRSQASKSLLKTWMHTNSDEFSRSFLYSFKIDA